MRETKDSGIEWIGKIPLNWTLQRVKHIFTRKNEKAMQENPTILSLARDGVKVRDISNNEGQIAESYYNYNPVEEGDLLLNPMDLYSGANCSISKVQGVISPAYINLRANAGINPKFYDYYFKVQYWLMAFFSYGKGVSYDNRWTLNAETLMNYPVVALSYGEQCKRADYLDRKCSRIDAVISRQQEVIEKLKAYKLSVITEAVTKGLNPDVPMKDSGIEWIGEIPIKWELSKIGAVYEERNEKVSDLDYPPLSVTKQGIVPQLETAAKTNYGEHRKLIRKNDFVINSRSDRRGSCGISEYDGSCSLINTVLKPRKNMCNAYYSFVFRSERFADEFYRWGNGIVEDLWSTKWSNMKRIYIPAPSLQEQRRIADYLDRKRRRIDAVIERKQEALEKLKAYKKALIYEVVTGKKEV